MCKNKSGTKKYISYITLFLIQLILIFEYFHFLENNLKGQIIKFFKYFLRKHPKLNIFHGNTEKLLNAFQIKYVLLSHLT